jgi:hypothetical protein
MIVKPAPTFTHPFLFLIGAIPVSATQVEPVGVLIIKQAFHLNGTPLPMPVPPPSDESPLQILMKDVPFPEGEKPPKEPGESDEEYKNRPKYESDLAAVKTNVDLLFIRNWAAKNVLFGYVWVTRNGNAAARFRILRGLRVRTHDLRKAKTGDSESFRPVAIPDPFNPPPLQQRLDLPDGFDKAFFNCTPQVNDPAPPGGSVISVDVNMGLPLQAGDVVQYAMTLTDPQTFLASVTIPAKPVLRFQLNGKTLTPVFRSSGVDTVILDWHLGLSALRRFLLTWRFVFVWEERFELATLEVT